jgi:putative tryptophan/tyrosine transport system substrate-binding protein
MQFDQLKRREFITLLGGAAAWPVAARAQQPLMPVIGLLGTASAAEWTDLVAAFRQGLGQTGFFEGQNLRAEYLWADGQFDRLPALAAELVQHQVAVIVTTGSANSTRAAKVATATIPIVFVIGTDPVKLGLVASFNRPGGNMTGVSWLAAALGAKQLELVTDLLPNATMIAMLVNPDNTVSESELKEVQEVSRARGREIFGLRASSEREIDAAFATLIRQRVGALLVSSDSLFFARRDQLVTLAARHAVPAIYPVREYAAAGGLMSYGTRLSDAYRQVGVYTGRILKGEKPGDLPIVQASKVELVVNLKTAKSLGITLPLTLLGRTDEVIE